MKLHRSYQDPFGIFAKYALLDENDGQGGGEGGGSGGGGGEGGEGGEGEGNKPNVNDIVAGRLRKEREAIAKTLGVPIEEAAGIIKKAKEAEEATLSATEKAKKEADEAKAESDKIKAEAARDRHDAKVERALLRELAKLELDDDTETKRLARLSRLIDLEVGADADEISKAIGALKDEWPELFGATAGNGGEPKGGKKGTHTDPPGQKPRNKPPERTAYERGAERAKAAVGVRQSYAFQKND